MCWKSVRSREVSGSWRSRLGRFECNTKTMCVCALCICVCALCVCVYECVCVCVCVCALCVCELLLFTECETEVKNLEAKLDDLKRENERLKLLINEAETFLKNKQDCTTNDSTRQKRQTEREPTHTAVATACGTSHCAVEGPTTSTSTSSSQFVSVAALLSLHTRNTQQNQDHAVVSLSQPQVQPAMSQASQTEVMTSSQGGLMTSQIGVSTSTTAVMASQMRDRVETGVTPQTGVVTSHIGVVVPHTGVMTLQTGMMTSQTGVTPPQTGVTTPQIGVMTSQTGVTTSQTGVTTSQTGVTTSQTGVTTSQTGVTTPQTGVMMPQIGVMTPQAGVITSQTGMSASQIGVMTPQTRVMTSKVGVVASQTRAIMSKRQVMTSQPGHSMLQTKLMTSQASRSLLSSQPSTITLQSDVASVNMLNQSNVSQSTTTMRQPSHHTCLNSGNATIERHAAARQYRLSSDCFVDSTSEPFTSRLPPRSTHTTNHRSSCTPTSHLPSLLHQTPNDVRYHSPSQPSNDRFASTFGCIASNGSASRYTSSQHITSSRDQAASYARDCMVMPRREDNNSRSLQHPESSRYFPRCEAGRLETDASVSLYLPDSNCQAQRNARRDTSSFSVLSLTGQSREQRSLSLPVHETAEQLRHRLPIHENYRSFNPQSRHVPSFSQWQEAPTVSYSPLKHIKPHEKFKGNFSINAIQGNRNMPSHSQPMSQFSIERLTSRQFEHNRVPVQSRFDIQSMITSRDDHVTPRVAPDQWESGSNYAVTTRLLGNDHHQESATTTSSSFLTHFNGQNVERRSRVLIPTGEQGGSYLSNCQWQRPQAAHVGSSTASPLLSFSGEVTSRTLSGQQLGWQASSYNGY